MAMGLIGNALGSFLLAKILLWMAMAGANEIWEEVRRRGKIEALRELEEKKDKTAEDFRRLIELRRRALYSVWRD